MRLSTLLLFTQVAALVSAKQISGLHDALAALCPGIDNSSVVCVNRYASVLPNPFIRIHPTDGSIGPLDSFPDTFVSDPSFGLIANATFLVFNSKRALEILGPEPVLEKVFDLAPGNVREAPVYIPNTNTLIFSTYREGVVPQSMIDLNREPPTLSEYVPDPPVYGVNGGRYHDGLVYWAATGGFPFQSPNGSTVYQTPGIVALDPETNKSTTLLNNYYGAQFNSPDDLVVASNGDVYFTDPWYGWAGEFTANPTAPPATWRFRPTTGEAQIIESTLVQPNGIVFSPDEKTLYIGDSGLTVFRSPPNDGIPFTLNSTGPRFLYAFDMVDTPTGARYPTNKRPIYMAHEFGLDGLQVSESGYLIGGTGTAVDILSPTGELMLQIRLDTIVNNIQFVGPDLDQLWIFGSSGVYRVKWELKGVGLRK